MGERRAVEERVGSALSTGKLEWDSSAHTLITALGLVGITERMADVVFRLRYANDAATYPDALAAVKDLARALAVRGNWRVRRAKLAAMAKAVLDYWLCDLCQRCNGLGFEKVVGTPRLSAKPCPACAGLKKRPAPWERSLPPLPDRRMPAARRHRVLRARALLGQEMRRHDDLLAALQSVEAAVARKLVKRLK